MTENNFTAAPELWTKNITFVPVRKASRNLKGQRQKVSEILTYDSAKCLELLNKFKHSIPSSNKLRFLNTSMCCDTCFSSTKANLNAFQRFTEFSQDAI